MALWTMNDPWNGLAIVGTRKTAVYSTPAPPKTRLTTGGALTAGSHTNRCKTAAFYAVL